MNAVSEPLTGAAALDGIVPVSHETARRLAHYVGLVKTWQKSENLVAPSTLPTIWHRHVADSAQLVRLFPTARRWADLGSGAGFPGMVVAILLSEAEGAAVQLVESNTRKCAFLRLVAREVRAPASVHDGRIEAVLARWSEPVEIVTARALAPLTDLLGMAAPLVRGGARAAFHKGQDFAREIAEASQSWRFDLIEHKSMVDDSGVILEITGIEPLRTGRGPT